MPPKCEEQDLIRSFQDRSNRFALDQLLRKYGFRIKRRHGKEEPVWERGGEECRESDALLDVPSGERDDAEYMIELYFTAWS